MTRFGSFAALLLAVLASALPALAAAPIQDGAGMFSTATVSQLDQQISDFTAQTGKQIVVVTVPSLNGKPLDDAAEAVFQQQNVNGVLIFIAKDDRKDILLPDKATAQFFPEPTIVSIRQSMEGQFKAEDYDGGITTAVTGILNVFRAHLNTAPNNGPAANNAPAVPQTYYPARRHSSGVPVFTIIIFAVLGYLILRSILRAMSGPRYYGGGPGYGQGPGPGAPGGPGYGGPGYGGYGGPGYYGGGGGFWSGLLGGLGGAWLGNEMFGNRGTTIVEQPGGAMTPTDQGGSWGGGNAGGWSNDAGQADMGSSSSGDWGGGGFGGGGGDFGGGGFGGGGDSGGGGGW
jgi:uncharacterized membrane protein YgcG